MKKKVQHTNQEDDQVEVLGSAAAWTYVQCWIYGLPFLKIILKKYIKIRITELNLETLKKLLVIYSYPFEDK